MSLAPAVRTTAQRYAEGLQSGLLPLDRAKISVWDSPVFPCLLRVRDKALETRTSGIDIGIFNINEGSSHRANFRNFTGHCFRNQPCMAHIIIPYPFHLPSLREKQKMSTGNVSKVAFPMFRALL